MQKTVHELVIPRTLQYYRARKMCQSIADIDNTDDIVTGITLILSIRMAKYTLILSRKLF